MLKNSIFFIIFCLPLLALCQPVLVYKNLALEGGGIRGIAYAGAFKILEDKGVLQNIENIAGSSAGAIAGVLLAVGYHAAEIDSILNALPFQKFNDGGGGVIGKYIRIKKRYGVYKGDRFENWVRHVVKHKTGNANLTFKELHQLKNNSATYKNLYITGTNLSQQKLQVFSHLTTPNLPIATAVRISGGIPLYFTPIALNNAFKKVPIADTTAAVNYYVDGGMLCNYPISMFDSCTLGGEPLLSYHLIFNKQTLGIKLERPEQIENFLKNNINIPAYAPKNIKDYFGAYINLSMEAVARRYPNLENEMGRSIYVSYGNISPRIKKMSLKQKKTLYTNGVAGALQFFKNHPL